MKLEEFLPNDIAIIIGNEGKVEQSEIDLQQSLYSEAMNDTADLPVEVKRILGVKKGSFDMNEKIEVRFENFKELNPVLLVMGFSVRHGSTKLYHDYFKGLKSEIGSNFLFVYNEYGLDEFETVIRKITQTLGYSKYYVLAKASKTPLYFIKAKRQSLSRNNMKDFNRKTLYDFFISQKNKELYFETFKGSQFNTKGLIVKKARPILDSLGLKSKF